MGCRRLSMFLSVFSVLMFSLALVTNKSLAQTVKLYGPTSVNINETYAYYIEYRNSSNQAIVPPAGTPVWRADGGQVVSSNSSTVSVKWTSAIGYNRVQYELSTTDYYYFDQLNISLNGVPAPPVDIQSGTVCGTGSITLSATPGANGNTIKWYSNIKPLKTATSYTTPILTSTTTYSVSTYSTTTGLESIRVPVTVPVTPIPGAPFSSDVSRCDEGVVTFAATPGVDGIGINWYESAVGGTPLASGLTFTTPILDAQKSFYVASTNGICEGSRIMVKAIINPLVNPPTVPSLSRCGAGEVSLTAIPGAGGNDVNWYVESSAGLELIGTGTNLTDNVLSTTKYFVKTLNSSTSCTSEPVEAYARINAIPAEVAFVQAERCGPGDVTLSGIVGTYGTEIRWYDINKDYLATGPSFITPTLDSSTLYYASSYNRISTCEGFLSPITAVVNSIPPKPIVMNYNRWGFGKLVLSASGNVSGGSYNWYDSSGALISSGETYHTEEIKSSIPDYLHAKSISNSGCESNATSVSINIYPLPEIEASVNRVSLGSSVTLRTDQNYDTYIWRNSNNEIVGLDETFVTSIPGVYTVSVTKYGVYGEGTSSGFKIKSIQEQDINYIITNNITKGGVTDVNSISTLSVKFNNQVTNYFDGVGRPIQSVITHGSPSAFDIIQPFVYDELGRESKKFLPFSNGKTGAYRPTSEIIDNNVSGNYIGEASGFYSDESNNRIASDLPYSQTVFENSFLNRPIKQGAPGQAWQPNNSPYSNAADATLKYSYELNDISDNVLFWSYLSPSAGTQLGLVDVMMDVTSRYYKPNELVKNKIKDENQNEVIEFVDKAGKTIVRRVQAEAGEYAETYYIYDNFGNLVCVLQPEGIKNINSYFAADELGKEEFLKKWAFRYTYDARKRMVMKQLPGADPVYLIYDNRDRLVLTQDGNQRSNDKNEWTFTKYDALNRPILTGIVDMGSKTVENLRDEVKDSDTYGEIRGSAVHGYTNSAYPNVADESKYLTVTYYDDYDFLSSWTGYDYTDEHLSATPYGVLYEQPDNHFPFVKGQVTGGKTKVLDGSNTWLKSVNYYDDKYRLVQTIADNHLGGIDKITNLYDFVGKVLKTRTQHNTQFVDRRFEYDHAGRLLETWHSIDGADDILLAKNEYNELGQLVTKKLHNTSPSSAFKQSVDYRYNIRGWLEKINDVAAPEPDDFFSMELKYNNPSPNGGNPQYNGNISEIVWKGAGMDQQSYGFYYDPMNRLTDANYFNATAPLTKGRFNERIGTPDGNGSRYDLNGNILHLTRHGKKDGSPSPYGPMDQLTYTYTGNHVTRIDDAIDKDVAEQGFKEEVKADNEYTYDANGNMIKDANKGITSITYNHLNLPVKVSRSETEYIEYTYDATGRKLRQQVFGTTPKTTDYQGEFVCENNVLQFINHEEGRVVMTGSTPEYQYHLKDHLGNVRLTFTSKEEVEESIATMEDANAEEEEVNYLYYNEAIKVNHPLFDRTDDHTPGGATHNATRLTGGNTNAVYGLARSLSVMPGDKINMEVWAKYLQLDPNPENWSASVRDFLTQYTEGSTTGVIDGGAAGSIGNTVFPYAGLLNRQEIDEQAPKAFITWLVFDRDYNPLIEESGYMQIGIDAKETGSNTPHQRLYRTAPLEIKQAGFVYIYLSNENETPVEVFFDDFKVEHIKSPVVQTQDYYPFGLAFNSYKRENSVENRIKFQGQEHIDDLGLNWDSFKWRNHQPDIGRFFNVDPLADKFVYNSPYAFAENKLGMGVELEGLELVPFEVIGWVAGKVDKFLSDKGLQKTEKQVALDNPTAATKIYLNENQQTAENFAVESGLPGLHNGPADALRHSLFNALNTKTAGEKVAKEFGDAHEEDRPGQPANEKTMDLHNNEMGRKVALAHPDASVQDLAKMLTDSLEAGKLKVLDSSGNIQPSSATKTQADDAKKKVEKLDDYGKTN